MRVDTEHFLLQGYTGGTGAATVEVAVLDRADRVRRAARHLGLCWGLAAVSVFIPVAHFLLVPGFAIGGITVMVRDFRTERLVASAAGTCPDCGAEQALDLGSRWNGPVDVACRHCHRQLRLVRAP